MLMTTSGLQVVGASAVALAAVAFDLRSRRIPNVLTFGASVVALVYAGATSGWSGLGIAAGGWLTGAALFFPFFARRGMGAGDVKLLAALGAWLGPLQALSVGVFAAMAGGVLAIVVSLAHGYLKTALSNVWLIFTHWRVAGVQPVPGLTLTDTRAPRLAYAVPVAVGLMVTLWRR